MGIFISRFLQALTSYKQPCRILLLGLDGAGKTTLLYKLKLNEMVTSIPTIGFNVETVEYKNISFTIWDVGGQTKIRPLWRHYFQNTQGLIFMTDSNDVERMAEAKEELWNLLEEAELHGVPTLVLANKQDLPCALLPSQVTDMLGLNRATNRKWLVQGTSVTISDGLFEGLDWMADRITES